MLVSSGLPEKLWGAVVYITMRILKKLCVFKWQDYGYVTEPDEKLIGNAAHLMVARLAGSLANVTC